MAGNADVRWRVVANDLPRISAAMADRADQVVRATALNLEAQAKMRAPVATGFLRGSIQAARVGPQHWRVTVGADYGAYVELGTVRAGPRPFVEPAVNIVRPAFMAAMRKVATG